ncbi:class I SAM-dependent methyltransferase [Streptomyces sp. NPDC050988]|uniref:class I SAM-dependent methyltransferase n=1 Tax=Streptomyces sp. NPDC050988 TaxID=3365637 RepID=UPI0037A85B14
MTIEMREGYEGTGPGAITPDGCAVELYSRLPVGDEPEIIAGAVPAGAHILELGSGVGRMTHPLLERGFTVTAVDESAEMLERVRGARTICSPIETLDLAGEKFDVVMLASFLVHNGDDDVRRGILDACRSHVADDGCVLIQREGEDYHTNLPRERTEIRVLPAGGWGRQEPSMFTIRMLSAEPVGNGVNSVRVEYVFPDAVWTQTFLARPLTKEAFEEALGESGLKVDRYLTEDRVWVRVVPA